MAKWEPAEASFGSPAWATASGRPLRHDRRKTFEVVATARALLAVGSLWENNISPWSRSAGRRRRRLYPANYSKLTHYPPIFALDMS